MPSLASHLNVWETCLQILERRQFRLSVVLEEGDCQRYYIAERGEIDLVADNPVELLGLAAIYEWHRPDAHEPYWWVVSGDERIGERLVDEALARQDARALELQTLLERDLDGLRALLAREREHQAGDHGVMAQSLGVSLATLEALLSRVDGD